MKNDGGVIIIKVIFYTVQLSTAPHSIVSIVPSFSLFAVKSYVIAYNNGTI